MRESFRRHRELAEFDGASHERVLDKFRQLDKERLRLAGQEVALAHYRGLPTNGGDLGEVGNIRREIQKKRRHLPLRKLLAEAGKAVQAIKPVFMMSPISVAQYLEPGRLDLRPAADRRGQPGEPGRRPGGDGPGAQVGRRRRRQAASPDAVLQQDARRDGADEDDAASSTRATWRAFWASVWPRGCRSGCSGGTTAAATIR